MRDFPCCESGECHRDCPDYQPTDNDLDGAATDPTDAGSYEWMTR